MVKKWRWSILIGIALIGVIVGSFLDLQINTGLYTPGNWFGVGMAAFGATPVYLCLSALGLGYILFALKKETKTILKVVLWCLGIGAIAVSIHFQADMLLSRNAFDIEDMWYVGYPVGLVIAGLGCTLGYFIFKDINDQKALITMIAIPLVLLLAILSVDIVKRIMCRPRFRFLNEIGTDYFCNWWESGKDIKQHFTDLGSYTKDVLKEEFRSFPSGHTVTTTSLIPFLVFLPRINNKFEKYEGIMFYIGIAWAMIMGFSRMLIGAHFLSDVSMGALISGIWGLIIDFSMLRNKKVENIEQEVEIVKEN